MESKEVVEKMDAAAGEARKELTLKPSMRHPIPSSWSRTG
jgi:hypothetical protein